MKLTSRSLALAFGALALASAACNPTVDPDATFTARGQIASSAGQPLAGAEVRLIKYSSDLNLFTPSMDELFAENPTDDSELGLHVKVVQTVRADTDGRFEMAFRGRDIRADNGVTTSEGRIEVATTVIVVRDPSDPFKRAGVLSYPHVYQDSDRIWEQPAKMSLWDAEATAETRNAGTSGLVELSWNKLDNMRRSGVKNGYRVDIFGEDSARLIIRCNEGSIDQGGCESSGDRLSRGVSAFSIYRYYSDANGMFNAYVEASGADFRHVARFEITAPLPDLTADREPAGIEGVWAVGAVTDQDLLGSAATDNNPKTTVRITNNADAIYVKLPLTEITDAGILNALVDHAADGCIVFELSVNVFSDLEAAKDSSAAAWTQKGRFCGETGSKGEVSALLGFSTSSEAAVAAAWMRVRAVPDSGSTGSLQFRELGEVSVFKRKM